MNRFDEAKFLKTFDASSYEEALENCNTKLLNACQLAFNYLQDGGVSKVEIMDYLKQVINKAKA